MSYTIMNFALHCTSPVLNRVVHFLKTGFRRQTKTNVSATLGACTSGATARKNRLNQGRAVLGQIPVRAHGIPLRIVRVLEAGQTRSSVGRMVISGRMADVCAELDRLAAMEAPIS
jgi:hypothetical protein